MVGAPLPLLNPSRFTSLARCSRPPMIVAWGLRPFASFDTYCHVCERTCGMARSSALDPWNLLKNADSARLADFLEYFDEGIAAAFMDAHRKVPARRHERPGVYARGTYRRWQLDESFRRSAQKAGMVIATGTTNPPTWSFPISAHGRLFDHSRNCRSPSCAGASPITLQGRLHATPCSTQRRYGSARIFGAHPRKGHENSSQWCHRRRDCR